MGTKQSIVRKFVRRFPPRHVFLFQFFRLDNIMRGNRFFLITITIVPTYTHGRVEYSRSSKFSLTTHTHARQCRRTRQQLVRISVERCFFVEIGNRAFGV